MLQKKFYIVICSFTELHKYNQICYKLKVIAGNRFKWNFSSVIKFFTIKLYFSKIRRAYIVYKLNIQLQKVIQRHFLLEIIAAFQIMLQDFQRNKKKKMILYVVC